VTNKGLEFQMNVKDKLEKVYQNLHSITNNNSWCYAYDHNATKMRTVANAKSMGMPTGLMANKEVIEGAFSPIA
jgi:hypothetical protein